MSSAARSRSLGGLTHRPRGVRIQSLPAPGLEAIDPSNANVLRPNVVETDGAQSSGPNETVDGRGGKHASECEWSHQNITGIKYIRSAAFKFGSPDRAVMNKTFGVEGECRVGATWPPSKWEFLCKKHLFMTSNLKILFKGKKSSDRNRGMQLMDHSSIDWLNTGIYLPSSKVHKSPPSFLFCRLTEGRKKNVKSQTNRTSSRVKNVFGLPTPLL